MKKPLTNNPDSPTGERVQKILAAAGLGSRRALEAQIRAGQIQVDGVTATLGQRVNLGETVTFGDQHFKVQAAAGSSRVLMYNKPEGVVCTRSDPEGRRTVFQELPPLKRGRWIGIGRLDINTSGLLLLTDDGELANAMMHPSSGVDREYACRVQGVVTEEMLTALKTGIELDDGMARFTDVVESGGSGENHWFHVVLMEGRNREVRRLWQAAGGVRVSRLKRVRYGAVMLPSRLKVGRWEEMSERDVGVMREDVGLPKRAAKGLTLASLQRRHAKPRPAKARPTKSRPAKSYKSRR